MPFFGRHSPFLLRTSGSTWGCWVSAISANSLWREVCVSNVHVNDYAAARFLEKKLLALITPDEKSSFCAKSGETSGIFCSDISGVGTRVRKLPHTPPVPFLPES